MFKRTLLTLAIAAASAASAPSWADTPTTTFNVQMTVTKACNFETGGTDVDFGSVQSTAGSATGAGSLKVNCTKGTTYDIGLSAGGGTSATVTARKMKGTGANTDEVPYALYRESARTNNWGNTVSTDTVGGVGTGATQTINVYGSVSGTNFTADAYSDIITATVTY
jgi:spore coat protein U-like protein